MEFNFRQALQGMSPEKVRAYLARQELQRRGVQLSPLDKSANYFMSSMKDREPMSQEVVEQNQQLNYKGQQEKLRQLGLDPDKIEEVISLFR